MKRFTVGVSSAAAALAASAALAAPAFAGTSVTAAIKSQDHVINSSAVVNQLRHIDVTDKAGVRRLIPKLKALSGKLDHAATVVSGAQATTSQQKLGQRDWVGGARDLATGLNEYDTALTDLLHGNKAGAARELKTAAATIRTGDLLGAKADRLLKLHMGA